MVTKEEQARIDRTLDRLDRLLGPRPRARPRVVTRQEFDAPVRDADVHVSRADPNAMGGADRVVEVRRPGAFVRINIAEWEEQQAERARARAHARAMDPYRLGLYGSIDDEGA